MWHVGQKVICIDDSFPRVVADWCDALPVAGHVYTIRAIREGLAYHTGNRGLGFHLVEIINPAPTRGHEAQFCALRFAPFEDIDSVRVEATTTVQ